MGLTVLLVVELEERRATRVLSTDFSKQRALADGTRDQDYTDEGMAALVNATSGLGWEPPDSPANGNVVDAEHRFAGRRSDHLNRWEPTAADIEALRSVVNKRAKKAIL
jgi:hypothetical protein